MKDLSPHDQAAQDYRLITNHTDFDIIEIEQTNKRYNNMQGIQICSYKAVWDDEDPTSPVIKSINPKVIGGKVLFVENPFARKPVKGGTGRVAFLINDDRKTPKGSLSGEAHGWNIEFLAAHYDEGWFVVVDQKWDKVVQKRHKAILKSREDWKPTQHKFDRKYAVKGIGDVDERIAIQVEQPKDQQAILNDIQEERKKMTEMFKEMREENKLLKDEIKKRDSAKPTKEEVLETENMFGE